MVAEAREQQKTRQEKPLQAPQSRLGLPGYLGLRNLRLTTTKGSNKKIPLRLEKTAPTAARTSPTGPSNNSVPTTTTPPSPNGTSSTTSTPSCTTQEYRERYAANLRRELPRIPFASATTLASVTSATTLNNCHSEPANAGEESAVLGAGKKQIPPSGRNDKPKNSSVTSVPPVVEDLDVFRQLVKAGERLAEIHVHYEQQPEYKLTKREKAGEKLNWRVTKMRLSKDKATLTYNDFLTLSGIPKKTYEYRLGNRSALEWVIDQYQVSTDKRSGITNDPNREDDPEYILRLIGQVITVSLETVKIVRSLPPLLNSPELP